MCTEQFIHPCPTRLPTWWTKQMSAYVDGCALARGTPWGIQVATPGQAGAPAMHHLLILTTGLQVQRSKSPLYRRGKMTTER